VHSFWESGNDDKCPFCNSDHGRGKTDEENIQELMKRVEANDAGAMTALGSFYYHGKLGLLQDEEKAMQLWTQAAELGSSDAHYNLGDEYRQRGDSKKEKFHNEAAAITGDEGARYNLGCTEHHSGNKERAVKHWMIAASTGDHQAMQNLLIQFKDGALSRELINSTLTAYNSACAEMRSEARDAYIQWHIDRAGE
jgi:TPR repeat protein